LDIFIENDPTALNFGDVVYDNTKVTVTGGTAEAVAQRLTIKLNTFLGEWFLNTTTGVPYYQQIFGKVRSKAAIDIIFRQQISSEPGVLEITDFFSDISAGRTYSLTFRVRTTQNQITETITINVGAA
jgi:enolase